MFLIGRQPEPRPEHKAFEMSMLENKVTTPDLRTQMESLLDAVWRSEASWTFFDRLDLQARNDEIKERRKANATKKETNAEIDPQRESPQISAGRAEPHDEANPQGPDQ
jgi:hypothetical protein